MALVNEYIAKLKSTVNPNRFRAKINFPSFLESNDASDLSEFMIQSTSVPSVDIGVIEIPIHGGEKLKVAGDKTYADWTATLICDVDFVLYKNFMKWSEYLKSTIAGTKAADFTYKVAIELTQLDGANQPIQTWSLIGAFPISIGELTMSTEDTDSYSTFDVTLSYDFMVTNLT